MSSKKIIIANWKQNGSLKSLRSLTSQIIKSLILKNISHSIVILPPYVYLPILAEQISSNKKIRNLSIGVQNVSAFSDGAYTGEVSFEMCKDFGSKYFLVGHSERRQILSESDVLISSKVSRLLNHNKKVILCVGETLAERKKKLDKKVISKQLVSALGSLSSKLKNKTSNIIIAYEPIWAIGSGKSASSEDIYNTHSYIKRKLNMILKPCKILPKVIYGGSVNNTNSKEILSIDGVDGTLVGGASLNAKKFIEICSSI